MDYIQRIYNLILAYLNLDENGNRRISQGNSRPAYLELSYTIPAGGREEVFQVFNYFRPISVTGGALALKFGDQGIETPFAGQGIGLRCEDVFNRLTLINIGGTSMTITIALAYGFVNDDRLNVSGTVTVAGNVNVNPAAAFTTSAAVSVLTTATTQVLAANTSRKEAIISNYAANNTVIRVGDGTAGEGIEVSIGGSLILSTTAAISVYNPSGSTISIGVAELV